MHFAPLAIGVTAFLIAGIFHPIVIKTEHYFSAKVWSERYSRNASSGSNLVGQA